MPTPFLRRHRLLYALALFLAGAVCTGAAILVNDALLSAPPYPANVAQFGQAIHTVPLRPLVGTTALRCQATGTGCAAALLRIINADRASKRAAPLTLDWTLAHGAGTCIGAAGHARHLADVVQSWSDLLPHAHDQFPEDVCGTYREAAENAGMAPGSKWDAAQTVLLLMLSEMWSPGCTGNHVCTLRQPSLQRIGIGFAHNGLGWVEVQDFTG